jgi:hypothetical protein
MEEVDRAQQKSYVRRRWIIIGRSPTDATRLLLSRVIGFRFEAHNLLTFSTTINIRYDQDPRTWSFFLALASITSIDSTTAQLITDFVVLQAALTNVAMQTILAAKILNQNCRNSL